MASAEKSCDCARKAVPDCPVCLETLNPPKRIFQCSHGHFLCEMCKRNPAMIWCPSCRGPFVGRNIGMEKMIEALVGSPVPAGSPAPATLPQDYGDPLLFNGLPLPLVVQTSGTVIVTGGPQRKTISCFAIGGGGGGGPRGCGGAGSGFINTGQFSVGRGEEINITIGQGGNYSDLNNLGGGSTQVGIPGISIAALGGEPGLRSAGGDGWSRGGCWCWSQGGGYSTVGQQGNLLPYVVCEKGRLVAGAGGKGNMSVGGGGGGVTFEQEKASDWGNQAGEGAGAGAGGSTLVGKSGLVVLYNRRISDPIL